MDSQTEIRELPWGELEGNLPVSLFTLRSKSIEVKVTNLGARLTAVRAPDRDGKMEDIVLGSEALPPYLTDKTTYLGAIVGRYANRIAGGRFAVDDRQHQVPCNDGANALHGGSEGFDQKLWDARIVQDGVAFTYVSPHDEMGFPGTLTVQTTYTLVEDCLRITYSATTDRTTIVNLTNHAYWNLNGCRGDISGHRLTLNADHYTPIDHTLIPTGKIDSVAGTGLDFRQEREIGTGWDAAHEQIQLAGGYDHNWVLNSSAKQLKTAAKIQDPESGRTLSVHTTEPGIQFYSGNFLDGSFNGRNGVAYTKRFGFCLETQHYPDSPNHPHFPSTVLRPGETARSTTSFTMGLAN